MNKVRRVMSDLAAVAQERNYKDARVWDSILTLQGMLRDELTKASAR